jgi:2-oxoglutarate dehydrogenase E2 component (dihydrolipoamide succinyltransferase)
MMFVSHLEKEKILHTLQKLTGQVADMVKLVGLHIRVTEMSFKDLQDKISSFETVNDALVAALNASVAQNTDLKTQLEAAKAAADGAPTNDAIQAVIDSLDQHQASAQAALAAVQPPAPATDPATATDPAPATDAAAAPASADAPAAADASASAAPVDGSGPSA